MSIKEEEIKDEEGIEVLPPLKYSVNSYENSYKELFKMHLELTRDVFEKLGYIGGVVEDINVKLQRSEDIDYKKDALIADMKTAMEKTIDNFEKIEKDREKSCSGIE